MTFQIAPNGPLWESGGGTRQHSAVALRRLLADLTGPGIAHPADLLVQPTAPISFGLQIGAGSAVVAGTEAAAGSQGSYHAYNDAAVSVVNPVPAHATLHRWDLLVVHLHDSDYSGTTATDGNVAEWVTGVASGAPVVPALPPNSLLLAQVDIPPGAATLVAANITDERVQMIPNGLQKYRARVYRSAAFTAGVGWATPSYDTASYGAGYIAGLNSNAVGYTAPVAGFYRVNARHSFGFGSVAGLRSIAAIWVAGVEYMRGGDSTAGATNESVGVIASAVVKANAGDLIQGVVYVSSAIALDPGLSFMDVEYDGSW